MAIVILVRHGRSTANTDGVLAGRMPGVELDETGREQAIRTGERLGVVPLVGVVSSPLERCRETAQALVAHQRRTPATTVEADISECDYGDWQGRTLSELTKENLWSVVQSQPSAAVFPGGESLAAMQARAVAAIRRHDAAIEAEHGPAAVWAAVSHGDVIKSILADALGMHLDMFQRIGIDPASASIISYSGTRPHVISMNSHAGDLSWLDAKETVEGGQVGGGAGPDPHASRRS